MENEAYQSPLSNDKLYKKAWVYTSTLPYVLVQPSTTTEQTGSRSNDRSAPHSLQEDV
jgi:hypothetical protein